MQCSRVVLIACLLFAGCQESDPPQEHDTAQYEYDQTKMAVAEKKGRETFPQFLERLKNPQPKDSSFYAKVEVRDGDQSEHMWLADIKQDGTSFQGRIDNDSAAMTHIQRGQIYPFTIEDVSDWMYFDDGVAQGNYTTRVLMESQSPEEVSAIKKQFGWK